MEQLNPTKNEVDVDDYGLLYLLFHQGAQSPHQKVWDPSFAVAHLKPVDSNVVGHNPM